MTSLAGILGCATSAEAIHDCNDGVDNDRDSLYDRADPGCTANGMSESPDPLARACGNSVDDDGDGLIDYPADPGCQSSNDTSEQHDILAQCNDGVDNDGDGRIDYPNEPGCIAPQADVELDPCPGSGCPACGNGTDDDGDGRTDYPDDLGCNSAADQDENNLVASICGSNVSVQPLPPSAEVLTSIEASPGELASPMCGGTGNELVYVVEAVEPKALIITTDLPATTVDTVVYLRSACRSPETELACNDDADIGQGSTIHVVLEPGTYYLIIDTSDRNAAGDIHLQVTERLAPGQRCSADMPQCLPGYQCRPRDSTTMDTTCELPACADSIDNDGDGRTDYPLEPGCTSATDSSELDSCPGIGCPACGNGMDDDSDSAADYPADTGCRSAADTSELDVCVPGVEVLSLPSTGTSGMLGTGPSALEGTCGGSQDEVVYAYRVDHDLVSLTFSTAGSTMDTVMHVRLGDCTSLSAELRCRDISDAGEELTLENPAAGEYYVIVDSNQILGGTYVLDVRGVLARGEACDPTDPRFVCAQAHYCSAGTCVSTLCGNGMDDDGDGRIDYPHDPGCTGSNDMSELDPCPTGPGCPVCANGMDDDDDGRIDYPQDLGCTAASAMSESGCVDTDGMTTLTAPMVTDSTANGTNDLTPSCSAGSNAADRVYRLTVPGNLQSLAVDTYGSSFDTVLSVYQDECGTTALGCNDDSEVLQSEVQLSNLTAGTYFIVVDGYSSSAGSFTLNTRGVIAQGQPCNPTQVQSGLLACAQGTSCTLQGSSHRCQ